MFKDFSFIVDIDGTICPIKGKEEKYEDIVPYKNIGLINKNTAKILLNWLEKWKIPYDEIIYGKPWPGHKGFYVDDRSVRPDEFLKYSVEELNEICNKSKEASK